MKQKENQSNCELWGKQKVLPKKKGKAVTYTQKIRQKKLR